MPILQYRDQPQEHVPPEWHEESVARAFELQRYFQVLAPAWTEKVDALGLRRVVGSRYYPAAHGNLERIIRELVDVRHETEEDEYGHLRGTEYAFSRTIEVVAECYAQMRDHLGTPLVSTDATGGIRLTWVRNDRQVRAVFPGSPSEHRYLYHEGPTDYAAVHNFDGSALTKWLRWLRGE